MRVPALRLLDLDVEARRLDATSRRRLLNPHMGVVVTAQRTTAGEASALGISPPDFVSVTADAQGAA